MSDRTTPGIKIRVGLPGNKNPSRLPQLEDLPGNASRILRLTYEDTEKGADKAKIDINNYDLRFPDDPTFDRGNMLYLQWGYPGNLCVERELVIVDWIPGTVFSIEAHAKAVLYNRFPVDETYDGMTYAEIAERVAERNGFGSEVRFIEKTPFRAETVVQPTIPDAQFMRLLANKIGFVFFVDASGWHFHSAAYGQRPTKRYEYFTEPGRGEVLGFPTFEKAPAALPGAVTVKGTDPVTKKPIEVRGDNATTAGRPGLAKEIEVIDKRTGQTALRPGAARETVLHTAAASPEEAKAIAHGAFRRTAGVPVKCTLPVIGDPQFQAKTVVELAGVGQRLSGLYYCQAATHSIEPGKYEMSLKLTRDGTNGRAGAGGVATEAKANTAKAPKDASSGGKLEAVEKIDGRTGQTKTEFRAQGPRGS